MSTVDDRPADDTERQLAAYFSWLDAELGPIGGPTGQPELRPEPTPAATTTKRWWLAAAAAVLVLVAGLALVVGRDGGEQVPASPTGDLRDVSGWFELDLPDVEVIESFTSLGETTPSGAEAYYVWADLDGDPIRSMSAYFPAGDVPTDLDDDVDPPAAIPDPPGGEAWVVDDPETEGNVLRIQWSRPDGSVVLTAGTGIDAATLAAWTFTVGADVSIPPSPPDPDLELLLDAAQVEPGAQYQENWVVDGADVSAWVSTDAPAVWFGLGYPTADRITVAGRDGYRFGGGGDDQAALVTFPLRAGYWGTLTMPAGRADELIQHVVVLDDTFPTPEEVTASTVDDDADRVDLASAWEAVVAEEMAVVAPDLEVELTSARETYPIGAVAIVPIDADARLLVDLRVWATGEYEDEGAWFDATRAKRFGTSFPEGAVFVETDATPRRVGIVTEQGVVQVVTEAAADADVDIVLSELRDAAGRDAAVALVRRLALWLPDVIAESGIDVDAGTVCADRACDGQVLARIAIASIGLDADVLASSRTDILGDGPGLAPGSVPIGSPGVVRIWGNRASHGAPFADLDRLGPGDRIVLTTPSDAVFTYVVESTEVVDVDTAVPPAQRSTLVLSTRHVTTERELRVTARICSGCPIDASPGVGVFPTLTTPEP